VPAATKIRLGVLGAGMMARRRARAFLASERVQICAVASRRQVTADAFGEEFACQFRTDDYTKILQTAPDAVLVEVPHVCQDEMVEWALRHKLAVLIGGPLSVSLSGAQHIREIAEEKGLVVEAGYEARYKAAWETTRAKIVDGAIGHLIAVQSKALWNANQHSWYYAQAESGGMPLTHMSYAFLNPLRWVLGDPLQVSALANRMKYTAPGSVKEETCVANLEFAEGVIVTMLAGYVSHDEENNWMISFLGTEGEIHLYPTEMDNGRLKICQHPESSTMDFSAARDAFEIQAEVFLNALIGHNQLRNQPSDCIGDLRTVEAIIASIRERRTISFQHCAAETTTGSFTQGRAASAQKGAGA